MSAHAWKRRRNKSAWNAKHRARPTILRLLPADVQFQGRFVPIVLQSPQEQGRWREQRTWTDAVTAHIQRAMDAAWARLAARV